MMTPKIVCAVGSLTVAVVLGAGCDLQKTGNQLTAKNVVVATLLATPPVELVAGAVAGLDASIPDAGLVFDGGFPDAGITVPPQTLVFVFFGARQGSATTIDVQPTPITGATVTLQEIGGASHPLSEAGNGTYQLLGADGGFHYTDHATYDFIVDSAGQKYVAELADAPAQERIGEFHPPAGYIAMDAGVAFTFTRPPPPSGQDRPLGFLSVYPVSQGGQGQPTYTNTPKTPLDWLKLIVAPQDWRQATVTIPPSAFPAADRNYVIVLQSAKLGGPKSDNLFTASAVLGGTADVGIVKTKP